jgi:hypothetical protein
VPIAQTLNQQLQITTTQVPFVVTLNPIAVNGAAATPSQAPVWTVSASSVLTLAVDASGLFATVTVVGAAGPCIITITGPGVGGTVTNHIQVLVAPQALVASFNPVASL